MRFYEKVIKVKADVAALLIFFSDIAVTSRVAWRAVKGQDERQKTAPLTALHATREVTVMSEKKIRRAATSALTFMTFS